MILVINSHEIYTRAHANTHYHRTFVRCRKKNSPRPLYPPSRLVRARLCGGVDGRMCFRGLPQPLPIQRDSSQRTVPFGRPGQMSNMGDFPCSTPAVTGPAAIPGAATWGGLGYLELTGGIGPLGTDPGPSYRPPPRGGGRPASGGLKCRWLSRSGLAPPPPFPAHIEPLLTHEGGVPRLEQKTGDSTGC